MVISQPRFRYLATQTGLFQVQPDRPRTRHCDGFKAFTVVCCVAAIHASRRSPDLPLLHEAEVGVCCVAEASLTRNLIQFAFTALQVLTNGASSNALQPARRKLVASTLPSSMLLIAHSANRAGTASQWRRGPCCRPRRHHGSAAGDKCLCVLF